MILFDHPPELARGLRRPWIRRALWLALPGLACAATSWRETAPLDDLGLAESAAACERGDGRECLNVAQAYEKASHDRRAAGVERSCCLQPSVEWAAVGCQNGSRDACEYLQDRGASFDCSDESDRDLLLTMCAEHGMKCWRVFDQRCVSSDDEGLRPAAIRACDDNVSPACSVVSGLSAQGGNLAQARRYAVLACERGRRAPRACYQASTILDDERYGPPDIDRARELLEFACAGANSYCKPYRRFLVRHCEAKNDRSCHAFAVALKDSDPILAMDIVDKACDWGGETTCALRDEWTRLR